ncbi:hypothetical protein [Pseudomonas sp. EA_65y_Pfl1_P120]|uniref:hypothetical protein n=1 Tax=Pseudomonas sp. EA_65y_Pfl1_P120 TaxID=3088693 RepID=UPI0030D8676A
MSIPTMTCSHVSVLKEYLSKIMTNLEAKPNGQLMYSFTDGLILNVYETTGRVVFQGTAPGGVIAAQIAAMINQINILVPTP